MDHVLARDPTEGAISDTHLLVICGAVRYLEKQGYYTQRRRIHIEPDVRGDDDMAITTKFAAAAHGHSWHDQEYT